MDGKLLVIFSIKTAAATVAVVKATEKRDRSPHRLAGSVSVCTRASVFFCWFNV